MSILKVKGNDSGTGTVTLEAPNTNTDQTINIPDGAGTIVAKDSDNNIAGIASINGGQIGGANLVQNGAMQIYQRGAGTLASGQFGPDRFQWGSANLDNLAGTLTQDSDAPDNFSSSLKITVTTPETSIASDEYAYLHQRIEAQNLQGLGYGTSSAKQVTLSFWVKSSVTGTFAVGLYKGDNTAQIHNKTYTINSASTWEYKTVTFSANTLSGGAIDNDNGIGLYVNWHLAAGSGFKGTSSSSGWISYVNSAWADGQDTDAVITTTNATWQLTGVQLEVGSQATDFQHEDVGTTLQKCQRYYQVSGIVRGYPMVRYESSGTGKAQTNWRLFPPMRATPSVSFTGTFASSIGYSGIPTTATITPKNIQLLSASNVDPNDNLWIQITGTDEEGIIADAEL